MKANIPSGEIKSPLTAKASTSIDADSPRLLTSTGIELGYAGPGRWSALVSFTNWKVGFSERINGTIGPECAGILEDVVSLARKAAEGIGVMFGEAPVLYAPAKDGLFPVEYSLDEIVECASLMGWGYAYL